MGQYYKIILCRQLGYFDKNILRGEIGQKVKTKLCRQ